MPRIAYWSSWLFASVLASAAVENRPSRHSSPDPEWLFSLQHEPKQPHSEQVVRITTRVDSAVTNVTLLYQVVEPGVYIEQRDAAFTNNWLSLAMRPQAPSGKETSFQVELPGSVQKHRRLVRYRINARDTQGHIRTAPSFGSFPPNKAYFVYDGIPAWRGSIDPQSNDKALSSSATFSPETMARVQAYHLLGKRRSIENATWRERASGKDYNYTGTLVVDGEVFDHVFYRARGGVWRYALGKNMWKILLPGDHELHPRDDFGRPYPVTWNKINLRACIQQGDYGQRGEQGLFESVGFRLFNLAGVPAPHTHWIQLRIIDQASESPPDQYRGDFWGLYLAIENEDGHFLKAHDLPSGNLFKMEHGSGELQHHGPGAATNLSDLFGFMSGYQRGNAPDLWWQTHFDLTNYYSYRAISECIHHYDVDEGKNYDYYLNPQTGQWKMIPWDIDLTWADNMYGSGEDPFKRRLLSRPQFRLEYQNRLREVRDLLFNPQETGRIIDEYAAVIWDASGAPSIVEADRRKWDYHPMMAMGMKAGQGLFYGAAPSHDFPGMIREMKEYIRRRGAWIDSTLLKDPKIPETPTISSCGPPGFPANQLRFAVSEYKGANAFAAIKWRLAEVAAASSRPSANPTQAPSEITAVWESLEMKEAPGQIDIPAGRANAGHTYRVRAKMKDVTGRWSHWSAPVEFMPGK